MKVVFSSLFILFTAAVLLAGDADKVIEADRRFAADIRDRGLQQAIKEHAAPGAFTFVPARVNVVDLLTNGAVTGFGGDRDPQDGFVSRSGVIGFTMGKSGAGSYLTVWVRQSNDVYKFAVSMTASSAPPDRWATFSRSATAFGENKRKIAAGDAAAAFYESARISDLSGVYKKYASREIVLMKDGSRAVFGRDAAVSTLKSFNGRVEMGRQSSFVGTDDLAYVVGNYRTILDGKARESGLFIQIWRFEPDGWRILADISRPQ
jgi:hypothetical protein